MNVKKMETTGHQRQQDIINVARRVTMLMNTGQLERGDVAEMTAFLLDLGVTTVKKYYRLELDHVGTPGKKRKKRPQVGKSPSSIDDFTIGAIRRTIYRMYSQGLHITLSSILKEIRENELDFVGGESTLCKLLKSMNFTWKKVNGRRFLLHRTDVVIQRRDFLRTYHELKVTGANFIFIDETWIFAKGTVAKAWQDDSVETVKRHTLGDGKRFIVVHAGGVNGFVPEAGLLFVSGQKSGDYHGEMNGNTFKSWMENLLISLEEPSVIIMDNAAYHSTLTDKSPNSKWKKSDVVSWLEQHNIPFTSTAPAKELLRVAKLHRPGGRYVIDEMVRDHGHEVLRLPPYHCHYNAIELVWSQCKTYFKSHMGRGNKFDDAAVHEIWSEALDFVTPERWAACVAHVEKIIEQDWEQQVYKNIGDVAPLIVHLGESGESSSEDDNVAGEGHSRDTEVLAVPLSEGMILLLAILAAATSEQSTHFSPFYFIKEIIQYLGDPSEVVDTYSGADREPPNVPSLPNFTVSPQGSTTAEDQQLHNSFEPVQNESELSLKLVSDSLEMSAPRPKTATSPSPESHSNFLTSYEQDSKTESVPDLHLIPGPPYSSQESSVAPATTATTPKTQRQAHDLARVHDFYNPSPDTQMSEIIRQVGELNSAVNYTDRGKDEVLAAFTSRPTYHPDPSWAYRPQASEEQTTTMPAFSHVPSSTPQQSHHASSPDEKEASHAPPAWNKTESSTTKSSDGKVSPVSPLLLVTSQTNVNNFSEFSRETVPSRESFTVPTTSTSKDSGLRTLHSTPLPKSGEPTHTLQTSSSNVPGVVYAEMPVPGSSKARGETPESSENRGAAHLSGKRGGSSGKDYASSGRSRFASESPSARLDGLQGSARGRPPPAGQFQPEYLQRSPQAPAEKRRRPPHVLDWAADVVSSQEAPPPVPALQVYGFPPHPGLQYFDPRSQQQVPEYESVPYYFGQKDANSYRTCQRLGQYYPFLPMQPVPPL